MADEEHYTDISDIMEDTETDNLIDNEKRYEDSDLAEINAAIQDSEILHNLSNEESPPTEIKVPNQSSKPEVIRSTRLPIARIKNIMKMDPDVSVVSADAVFLVTKATELFLETIAKETYSYTSTNKRKVISKKDLDLIINKVDCLCFLEGAMDF